MSDDKVLGRVCFVFPRRLFALLVAGGLWVSGVAGICYLFVHQQLPGEEGASAWQAQDRCVGTRCQDVLTCRGLRQASFHTREVVFLFCSVFFGYWGLLGALHSYVDDLRWFANFLNGYAGLLAFTILWDGAYTLVCGAYPLNVVDEALLWPMHRVPVRDAVKLEIRDAMVEYPVELVDRLAQMSVFTFYVAVELVVAAFFIYAAQQVTQLAQFMSHGDLGLGAIYDIRDWKERVSIRRSGRDAYGYQATTV